MNTKGGREGGIGREAHQGREQGVEGTGKGNSNQWQQQWQCQTHTPAEQCSPPNPKRASVPKEYDF